MRYCLKCQTGEGRQLDSFGRLCSFCLWCGSKLVDMPTEDCACGQKPSSHNAFCINCGKELKPKTAKSEILKQVGDIVEKLADEEV